MSNIDNNCHVISKRGEDWLDFSAKVFEHLENYTVPQYGDKGDDLITNYSIVQCLVSAHKYVKRYGNNQRKGQQELDFLKMAHYIQCAHEKYINQVVESKVITKSFDGDSIIDVLDDLTDYIDDEVRCVDYKNVKITVEVIV